MRRKGRLSKRLSRMFHKPLRGNNRFKNSKGRNAKQIARSKRHRLHAFYK